MSGDRPRRLYARDIRFLAIRRKPWGLSPESNAIAHMNIDSPAEPQKSITATRRTDEPDLSAVAIRGGAIRVAGYIAGVFVSLAAATILVRHLGVPTFGRYVTVTSLIAVVGAVTEAGIYVYGIREFSSRTEPSRRDLMSNLLTMRLMLTLVGIAVAACFALVVGYREVLVLGTLVAGVGLLFQVTSDVLSIPLQAQLRLGRLAVVDLSRRLIALLLIGVLALLGASLLPLIAASTVAGAAALVLLAWVVRSSIRIRLNFDWKAWRALFAETLPYAIAVSIGAIYFYVTIIVMSLIASANQTGLFATSFRVTQVALGIPILLLTAIFPLMSHERTDRERVSGDMVGKVFSVAVIGGVWMSLAMALGAPFIIDVIAGSPGKGAVSVLRIQSLVFIPSFISSSCGLILISLRHYRRIIIVSSAALALNIVLALALVPALGARGGALGDVLTETLVAIGLTAMVLRAVPRHRIRASVAPPVLLALALSATVLLLPLGSAARVIVATIIYFGVLMLTRTIPNEVTDAARRLREVLP
jgi:O-antigen/teichoic acid export membrane protein